MRRRHKPACGHCPRVRQLGQEFQAWRHAWELQAESATGGYAAELSEYTQGHPAPTFRRYLEDNVGAGWPMSGRMM